MPLINFKASFVEKIIAGQKRMTIRKIVNRPLIKKGDNLFLYTGLRTKQAKKLFEVQCAKVHYVKINTNHSIYYFRNQLSFLHCNDPMLNANAQNTMSSNRIKRLAQKDGFLNVEQFFCFFEQTHGLPFFGQIIYW